MADFTCWNGNGAMPLISDLVANGYDLQMKDSSGMTRLHNACLAGDLDMVVALIHHGVKVNCANTQGMTPLHFASSKGHNEIVEVLLHNGANVDAYDMNGWTPLHFGAAFAKENVVRTLIKWDAELDAVENTQLLTPLFFICQNGNADIAITLAENGAETNMFDRNGRTPLHWAVIHNYTDIALFLLENDARVNIEEKGTSYTPLHWACKNDNLDLIRILVERGADLNSKDRESWTPFNWATLYSKKETIDYLLSHGADPNAQEQYPFEDQTGRLYILSKVKEVCFRLYQFQKELAVSESEDQSAIQRKRSLYFKLKNQFWNMMDDISVIKAIPERDEVYNKALTSVFFKLEEIDYQLKQLKKSEVSVFCDFEVRYSWEKSISTDFLAKFDSIMKSFANENSNINFTKVSEKLNKSETITSSLESEGENYPFMKVKNNFHCLNLSETSMVHSELPGTNLSDLEVPMEIDTGTGG